MKSIFGFLEAQHTVNAAQHTFFWYNINRQMHKNRQSLYYSLSTNMILVDFFYAKIFFQVLDCTVCIVQPIQYFLMTQSL